MDLPEGVEITIGRVTVKARPIVMKPITKTLVEFEGNFYVVQGFNSALSTIKSFHSPDDSDDYFVGKTKDYVIDSITGQIICIRWSGDSWYCERVLIGFDLAKKVKELEWMKEQNGQRGL